MKLHSDDAPASVQNKEWKKDDREKGLHLEGAAGSQNGACAAANDVVLTAPAETFRTSSADAAQPCALDLNGKSHYTPAQSPPGGNMSRGEDLLRRIADKDEAAFAEFVQEYGPPIFRYLRTLLRNYADAEDRLQEVMIVVWNDCSACKDKESPLGWLFGIARNKAYSFLRRELPKGGSEPVVELPDPSQDHERILIARESVHKALPRLSAKHRDVIELRYFGGLSYREISQVIGCPVGTVKSRLYHALEKLFQILKKDWEN